jgi:hypothetical protein
LQEEVDRLTREASEEADRQMHKRIREAFLRALAELPTFGGISASISDPAGHPEHGEAGEEATIQPPPTDMDGGNRGSGPKPPRPPIVANDVLTNARTGVGFNLIEAPLNDNPDLHSDFNPSAVLIRVNTLHPDYQRESAPQDRRESYLVRLIAKEMTLYEYPDTTPDNLIEKLLDLELAARRNLEASGTLRSVGNGRPAPRG